MFVSFGVSGDDGYGIYDVVAITSSHTFLAFSVHFLRARSLSLSQPGGAGHALVMGGQGPLPASLQLQQPVGGTFLLFFSSFFFGKGVGLGRGLWSPGHFLGRSVTRRIGWILVFPLPCSHAGKGRVGSSCFFSCLTNRIPWLWRIAGNILNHWRTPTGRAVPGRGGSSRWNTLAACNLGTIGDGQIGLPYQSAAQSVTASGAKAASGPHHRHHPPKDEWTLSRTPVVLVGPRGPCGALPCAAAAGFSAACWASPAVGGAGWA